MDSVLAQTFTDFECLLINDGSKDKSGEICDEYATKDSRVKVFHKENGGVSSARNVGLDNATGEWIAFVDSDDSICIDACARVIEYAESHAADCVVFGFLQASGSVWAPESERVYENMEAFKKDFVFWLNSELLSSSVNKLYKREHIKSFFPEGMSFGEDLVFSLNYIKHCDRICFVPWPIYFHNNLNECSLTHTMRNEQIFDIEQWQTEIFEFVGNAPVAGDICNKYLKDVLLWLKRFYASNGAVNSEKMSLLRRWYNDSHLKRLAITFPLDMIDTFIIVCLKLHLWMLPLRMLRIKHFIIGNR